MSEVVSAVVEVVVEMVVGLTLGFLVVGVIATLAVVALRSKREFYFMRLLDKRIAEAEAQTVIVSDDPLYSPPLRGSDGADSSVSK